nr:hypothetical protein [Deltaproteobacteria bacterium]
MMPLDELTGGVEYLPLGQTQGKIFQVRANPEYRSYSDSVLLDEEVDTVGAVRPGLSEGTRCSSSSMSSTAACPTAR